MWPAGKSRDAEHAEIAESVTGDTLGERVRVRGKLMGKLFRERCHRIGVPKYDDVKEKHQQIWGSVKETNVRFHDYLQAFGKHSDEVMLTIRRYERDILDGKLGVTREDWQEIFKKAVIHYRQICPNLRYIEVCNEYALSPAIAQKSGANRRKSVRGVLSGGVQSMHEKHVWELRQSVFGIGKHADRLAGAGVPGR
jgi:hypothetical protein